MIIEEDKNIGNLFLIPEDSLDYVDFLNTNYDNISTDSLFDLEGRRG